MDSLSSPLLDEAEQEELREDRQRSEQGSRQNGGGKDGGEAEDNEDEEDEEEEDDEEEQEDDQEFVHTARPPRSRTFPFELTETRENRAEHAAVFLHEGLHLSRFSHHPATMQRLRVYRLLHSAPFRLIEAGVSIFILLLAIIEKPAVWTVPLWVQGLLENGCLVFFAYRLYIWYKVVASWPAFLKDFQRVFEVLAICIFVLDWFLLIADSHYARIGRVFRPYFFLSCGYGASVRRVVRQFAISLFQIIDTLLLLVFFVVVAAVIAFNLYYNDNEHFSTYNESVVTLFIMLSGANYPNDMMKSFKSSRFSGIFFACYMAVGFFLLLNTVLAVINQQFAVSERVLFKREYLHQRKAIRLAFLVSTEGFEPTISYKTFQLIMKNFDPRLSKKDIALAFFGMKRGYSDGGLRLRDLYYFYDVRGLSYSLDMSASIAKGRSQSFKGEPLRSSFMTLGRKIVCHPYFSKGMDIVIGCNTIALVVAAATSGNKPHYSPIAQYSFLTIYWIELVMCMLFLGVRRYFSSGWHILDFLVVTVSTLALIIARGASRGTSTYPIEVFSTMLRSVRLFRLLRLRQSLNDILITLIITLRRMVRYFVALFLVYYTFAVIGMAALRETISRCTEDTCEPGFYFREFNFQLCNFDNIFYAYNTLFILMAVGGWDVIMDGHVDMSSKAARIYFFLCYLINVLVMWNVVVSFIIQGFRCLLPLVQVAERKKQQGVLETDTDEHHSFSIPMSAAVELFDANDEDLYANVQRLHYVASTLHHPETMYHAIYGDDMEMWRRSERAESSIVDEEVYREERRDNQDDQAPTLTKDVPDGPSAPAS
eukprot:m.164454 g.164454  ORF g.164454 m.164454 type:complete len:823 (+) comp17134_c0_seq3:323-2791(+)